MNAPALRFRDNDAQKFPEWEKRNISEILKIGSGKDYKKLKSGDIPVYGTGGYMLSVNDYLYDGESVCIGRKGTIDRPVHLSGKFWTVDTLFYTHSFVSSLPKFIYALFQNIDWKNYNEASGVPSLSKSTIEKIEVFIPSLPEQTKIANFLTAVDEKITLLTQKADLLSQYKKGVMQQIFSQELRFKDDDGQEFPEWEEKTLGEISDVKGGKRLAKGYSLQHENNGMPYITVSDMYQGSVDVKNIKYVPSEIAESIKNYKISINDIFISVAGTLGIVGIIPKELDNANLTENANKLTNLKCNQKYLLQYLMSDTFGKLIDSVKTTNAQPKLAIYAINSFATCLPSSIKEQTKIANFLTAIDDKITNHQTQLNAVKQYKQGLLQQLFV